jgi:hypothetical protein
MTLFFTKHYVIELIISDLYANKSYKKMFDKLHSHEMLDPELLSILEVTFLHQSKLKTMM